MRYVYEDTYQIDVRLAVDFIPGRPAHTPRGEYAPIDPPDPPEASVVGIQVKEIQPTPRERWRDATPEEAAVLFAWADSIYDEIVSDAERQWYESREDRSA